MNQEELDAKYERTGWGQSMAVPGTVFTIYSFLCFAQCCGFGAQDATQSLSFGIIQVILFIGFFFGSAVLIKRGDAAAGQTYMIFAIAFGGVGGVSNILSYCAAQGMLTYDPFMFGIVNMVIGIILVFELPLYIHGDLITLDVNITPCIGLILFGITGMGLCPAAMNATLLYIAGIMFLLCGIGGFIVLCNSLLEGVAQIPTGPVLFKDKNAE